MKAHSWLAVVSRRTFLRVFFAGLGPVVLAGCTSLSSARTALPTQSSASRSSGSASETAPSASSGPAPRPSASPLPTQVEVFLDPGHGGVDTGAVGVAEDGTIVEEKDITLSVARQTAAILRARGTSVALSRTDDSLPSAIPADNTADGAHLTTDGALADLQRRIDRANASGARVLLSIHFEYFDDPSVRGAETFYDSARSFAAKNARFATLVQDNLVGAFRAIGDDTPDRGITADTDLIADLMGTLPDYHHLVVLGPGVPGLLNPSQMPGALCEPLFLSNPTEASAARDPAVQQLIATAFAQAIRQFLAANP